MTSADTDMATIEVEATTVDSLRQAVSAAILVLLWIHLPMSLAISVMRAADWAIPAGIMVALAGAATLAWWMTGNGGTTRNISTMALMGGVAVMVWQMGGHP